MIWLGIMLILTGGILSVQTIVHSKVAACLIISGFVLLIVGVWK